MQDPLDLGPDDLWDWAIRDEDRTDQSGATEIAPLLTPSQIAWLLEDPTVQAEIQDVLIHSLYFHTAAAVRTKPCR